MPTGAFEEDLQARSVDLLDDVGTVTVTLGVLHWTPPLL